MNYRDGMNAFEFYNKQVERKINVSLADVMTYPRNLSGDLAFVSNDILRSLETNTDKAALYAHEIIYKLNRGLNGHKLSDESKEIVSLLFMKLGKAEREKLDEKLREMFRPLMEQPKTEADLKFKYIDRGVGIDFATSTVGKEITEELYAETFEAPIGFKWESRPTSPFGLTSFYYGGKRLDTLLSDAIRAYNVNLVKFLVEEKNMDLSKTVTGFTVSKKGVMATFGASDHIYGQITGESDSKTTWASTTYHNLARCLKAKTESQISSRKEIIEILKANGKEPEVSEDASGRVGELLLVKTRAIEKNCKE